MDTYEWFDEETGRRYEVYPSFLGGGILAVAALTGEGRFDDQVVRRELLRLAGEVRQLKNELRMMDQDARHLIEKELYHRP